MRTIIAVCLLLASGCAPSHRSSGASSPDGTTPIAVLEPYPATLVAGEALFLSAVNSYDPNNAAPAPPHGIAEFQWSLTSGDNAALTGSDASATITTTVAGVISGQLVVVDEDGLSSSPETFSVNVTPAPNPVDLPLRVEVAWNTDTVDVDLHVLEESAGGAFGVAPYDCFYGNATPDWGAAGPDNDPIYSNNDSDGYGPENITIPNQDPGTTYRIVAHYYSDDGVGPTDATLRVYLSESIEYEATMTLLTSGQMWEVATITDGVVTPL